MERKRVFRIKWGLVIATSAIILLLNIFYAIWGCSDNKTEVLTVISGWVSGIATFLIGVIAFSQNERYKADSDESLEKQYQFETAKLVLNSRVSYIQNVKDSLGMLIAKCDCNELLHKVKEIESLRNPNVISYQQNHLEIEVDYFYKTITAKCNQIINLLEEDKVNSEENSAVSDAARKYSEICVQYCKSGYIILNEHVLPVYNELVEASLDYFKYIDEDMHSSIGRIRDYNYIVEHYCANNQKSDR